MTQHAPFRYDIVGSYLRPDTLKKARQEHEEGKLDYEGLRRIEDEAIVDLIKKQVDAGLKSITDGEFRRSWWHLDFFWGLKGVEKVLGDGGYQFHDKVTRAETARLNGKVSGENHPFVDDYKFLKANTPEGVEARQTIPAPAQFIAELERPENIELTTKYYSNFDDLVEDIATAYAQVAKDLYDAGLRTLQIDDCTWGMLAGKQSGVAIPNGTVIEENEAAKALYVKANNAFIAKLPKDLVVTTHVCRGNYNSSWASKGAYDSVATPLFDEENVSAYYLEYDTDRSGGFEPLAKVTPGKKVVLGLVTSKNGTLENREDIIARIKEASRYVPLEDLYLSTQCGFASTEEGNILTEDDQWAKIALVKSIAEEVWS
ncbi:5-methyltetrahydropteroyltriglutamate--homocysteine S-methyltransferase [Dolosicoccus paucivorans]|uniref:5-methyltetrahydropteroyltriglutamate--homocysteine S-methyltransferase n=1 Tax=Dolosicoccus paucivorans TaxID=84521 RepID=A0A1G8JNQ2_9LACT|nr:5-methyltetrahydropteroyltriglutamate--homocysteine S-methyltransferase [Dolosicoccus paucivorans]PMB84098.1 5-methyltetrahydropteroyltriglutamate--homocysteine S-methyltransferase [Dolosicoccus paucivorans]PMC58346.1 5-methyltetrahydropteroyltriglutamate--homocysteine S-methyltransferase [Dolosicoccus paucivorans]SDI32792.1 Methionine synthase II (cobalamin-independent) [Dolosicoccus paucivorans]